MHKVLESTWTTDVAIRTVEKEMFYERGGANPPESSEGYLVRNMVYCVSADCLLFSIHASEEQNPTLLGVDPKTARIQDELWMLKGGNMLYVLRPNGQTHQ